MKNIVKILLAVLTGSRACSRSEKRTSLFFSFLIAFMLSLVPTTYVCAQGSIETPAERKAREAREAEAKRKKQQQDAAARRQREEEARKKREAEEQAAREAEVAAREQAAREQAEREEAERKKREAEEAERMRPFRELEANMVCVEGGTFAMGSYWDKPIHQVTLSTFYLCKYEVTQELWQAVMGNNPSEFFGLKRPVENVDWWAAQRFITKLNQLTGRNYRLPTEAEWEYAARSGNREDPRYNLDEIAWYEDNSDMQTHDVGMKHANGLGLYDMLGNVWEWCQDWYGKYESKAQTNPKGPAEGPKSTKVMRGGCYAYSLLYNNVSHRGYSNRSSSSSRIGLRLAE